MGSHGSPADNPQQPERLAEPRDDADGSDSSALESILKQTLSVDAEPLSDALLARMRQVVGSYPDEEFALEPHGTALVRAILAETWASRPGTHELRFDASTLNQTAREVAEALANVDEVWQRVKRLWLRLGEATE